MAMEVRYTQNKGFEVSEFVKQIFKRELLALAAYKEKKYEQALTETFKRIDEVIESPEGQKELRKIRNQQNEGGNEQFIGGSVGCTANVVLITQDAFYVANSGDSRSSLCRAGKALDLSFDHKP